MSRRTVLFALAGAGAGNVTRCTAIIEELDRARIDVVLAAQGRARQYAPSSIPLHSLRDVTYGAGPFTAWNILRSNWRFPFRFIQNRHQCARIMDEVRPHVLVTDSDIYAFTAARRLKIPILSLNSSAATIAHFRRLAPQASGMRFSFHVVEKLDRWLQMRYADRIICPVLERVDLPAPKVTQTAPIVRRQFLAASGDQAGPWQWEVAVMLGASGIGASEIDLRDAPGSMVVLGDVRRGRYPPAARRIPFTTQPASYLADARTVVIQGGLNSVSEVVALRKPAVVVPIPHHAEQFVNAALLEKLGAGVMATGPAAGSAVGRLLEHHDAALAACRALTIPCDGATSAARMIEDACG